MLNSRLSKAQYEHLCASRSTVVARLIQDAIGDQCPSGYAVMADPQKMAANALLAVRQYDAMDASKMISFSHAIHYRNVRKDDRLLYSPTREFIRAHADIKQSGAWRTDSLFGQNGVLEVAILDPRDLITGVATLVAQACAYAPFTRFEWRKRHDDQFGKWDLFDGDRKLQTVWKSGHLYGTLMGTCPKTLHEAQRQAEDAARYMLRSEHAERLARLYEASTDLSLEDDAPCLGH